MNHRHIDTKRNTPARPGLWSRDFTIITAGSVVSVLGHTISAFLLSVLVLDYTGSTMMYAAYQATYLVPWLICPLLAGPLLDRVSRKKMIYGLDFLAAGLYFLLFVVLGFYFSYPLLLLVNFVIGAADSVYLVAYDSLYPNLIPKGYSAKAYSVSAMLESVSLAATPLAAMIYGVLGTVRPFFLFSAVCFFTAACFECTIRHQETHIDTETSRISIKESLKRFGRDSKEGLLYLAREKGLLFIALYYAVSSTLNTACGTLYLPFFTNNAELFAAWPIAVVTLYAIVNAFAEIGQMVGGLVHYLTKIPARLRFALAFAVYVLASLIMAGILYLNVPLMALAFFILGLLGISSYNIRVTSTQAYVPDHTRARFNGIFTTIYSLSSIVGTLMAGGAATLIGERASVTSFGLIELVCVILIMMIGKNHICAIYNVDLSEVGEAEPDADRA